MKHLALLPIHLGLATSALTPDNISEFYLWLGEFISGVRCEYVPEETRIGLALDNSAIEDNSPSILDRFLEHLKVRVRSTDLVIADLATSQKGLLRGGILAFRLKR